MSLIRSSPISVPGAPSSSSALPGLSSVLGAPSSSSAPDLGAPSSSSALLVLALLLLSPLAAAAQPAAKEAPAELTVVFLGDSLTAGFGLDAEQAFPALVEKALLAEGRKVKVVNAGISGDTSAGGLARMDWLLKRKPDLLVVCLGANDGLRGLSLESSEKNLRGILEKGKAAGATLLLIGMQIPPNYGPDYTRKFAEIYPRLAKEQGISLLPFLLEGVAGRRELNQADGIHPTAEGQQILARTVLSALRPLISALHDEREKKARP